MEMISVHELEAGICSEDSDFLIIDIREPHEYVEESIPASENIPINKIEESLDKLKRYEKVFVSCRSGRRSATISSFLKTAGINAINVSGGLIAWKEAGFEVGEGA